MNKAACKNLVCAAVLAAGIPGFLQAQEQVMDLSGNPVIIKHYRQSSLQHYKTEVPQPASLALPFLDDFSKESIYPDGGLWLDSNAFINRSYPVHPPTLGVATLDGVSKTGMPYDTLASNNSFALADYLTSRPINLSGKSGVFLSFYWQAMGMGNRPDPADSLVLQFYDKANNKWNWKWSKSGYTILSPPDTSKFNLVMIPVTQPFLTDSFQFRFLNYATLSGNVDHWHIDYVYLDENRNPADTIFDDVAFVYDSRPLLQNYHAMPWEQYQSAELRSNLRLFIRNNDTAIKNTNFKYDIYNSSGIPVGSHSGGNQNIFSFHSSGYSTFFNNPPSVFPTSLTLTQDSIFLIEYIVTANPDDDRWNDTLRFWQRFTNYFAYDDGTVEAGYGFNTCQSSTPGIAQAAYRFTLNQADTLAAVQILFNWIVNNVHSQQIKIRVWNDASGVPGSVLYESGMTKPGYQYIDHPDWGNTTNVFYPYVLPNKLNLPAGTFYVGFITYMNPCSLNINVGLDMNTDSRSKMFYNIDEGWKQTQIPYPCSWMIRPVLRNTNGLFSGQQEITVQNDEWKIFPNPSAGTFRVYTGGEETREVKAFNLLGEEIFSAPGTAAEFNLSGNPPGIYFVRITGITGKVITEKFILSR